MWGKFALRRQPARGANLKRLRARTVGQVSRGRMARKTNTIGRVKEEICSQKDSYVRGLARWDWRRERSARPMSSSPWSKVQQHSERSLTALTARGRSQGLPRASSADSCATPAERLRLSTCPEARGHSLTASMMKERLRDLTSTSRAATAHSCAIPGGTSLRSECPEALQRLLKASMRAEPSPATTLSRIMYITDLFVAPMER